MAPWWRVKQSCMRSWVQIRKRISQTLAELSSPEWVLTLVIAIMHVGGWTLGAPPPQKKKSPMLERNERK
jgi:hypothetical protein